MNTAMTGRALKYGDNINTDIISPPQYMELTVEEAAQYAMGGVDPDFAAKAGPDTFFVAGQNLGSGSSRETSPLTLRHLGIRVLIAASFARIFYRNCINLGLIPLECPSADKIRDNDLLEADYTNGIITNHTRRETYACSAIPPHILELITGGGLVALLQKQYANTTGDMR